MFRYCCWKVFGHLLQSCSLVCLRKTKFGAYLAIFGAVITLALNFALIPVLGFEGSAWATLICYFAMAVVSYFLGREHYPIPYDLKRIGAYLGLMLLLFRLSGYVDLGMWVNTFCSSLVLSLPWSDLKK